MEILIGVLAGEWRRRLYKEAFSEIEELDPIFLQDC